jgi:ribosome biogenesis GTPase
LIENEMNANNETLTGLGWSSFFQSQIEPDLPDGQIPARVMAVHRDALVVAGTAFTELRLAERPASGQATVGDWVLVDRDRTRIVELLERRSLFKRRAAGRESRIQLIAANVDTLLIVSSCNDDFNVARLERYLVLAREAEVEPLLVLTKSDLAVDPGHYAREGRRIAPNLMVIACDARDLAVRSDLAPWLGRGQTLALVGSSGVGKTTLVNTLAGEALATAPIREDDAKGRHTTTSRSLHSLPGGAWLVDMPGMRELQLADAREGVDALFVDIIALGANCRFTDCRHETEPGCAVQSAVAAGELDMARLERFRKLRREEAFNSASIAERRTRSRAQGKLYKSIVRAKRERHDEP